MRFAGVALFIPCLVDLYLPEVGAATARLLAALGLDVSYDPHQTCCGQPAHNAGHAHHAAKLAARALHIFAATPEDHAVVAPSGSCVAMLRHHAPEASRAAVADRMFELTEFVTRVLGFGAERPFPGRYPRRVAFHPSCHTLRELGLEREPQALLGALGEITLVPLAGAEACCGFGGTFSMKQPEVSRAMGRTKLERFLASGADELITGDPGCLLQMRALLRAAGEEERRARHIAQVLWDAHAALGDEA